MDRKGTLNLLITSLLIFMPLVIFNFVSLFNFNSQDKNIPPKNVYTVISATHMKETDEIKVKYNKTFYSSETKEIVVPKNDYFKAFLNNRNLGTNNKGPEVSNVFSGKFKIEKGTQNIILLSEDEFQDLYEETTNKTNKIIKVKNLLLWLAGGSLFVASLLFFFRIGDK